MPCPEIAYLDNEISVDVLNKSATGLGAQYLIVSYCILLIKGRCSKTCSYGYIIVVDSEHYWKYCC